jgi:hypothetical protein
VAIRENPWLSSCFSSKGGQGWGDEKVPENGRRASADFVAQGESLESSV